MPRSAEAEAMVPQVQFCARLLAWTSSSSRSYSASWHSCLVVSTFDELPRSSPTVGVNARHRFWLFARMFASSLFVHLERRCRLRKLGGADVRFLNELS